MMIEDLNRDREDAILTAAFFDLTEGRFTNVLSGKRLRVVVALLSQLRDEFTSGKRKVTSYGGLPNEIFLEFMTTKNLDRQNATMFTMLKQAGFDKPSIEKYFLEELMPKYRDTLHFPPERITTIKESVTKALDEVFPTLN